MAGANTADHGPVGDGDLGGEGTLLRLKCSS
jgi:hypothetical protein